MPRVVGSGHVQVGARTRGLARAAAAPAAGPRPHRPVLRRARWIWTRWPASPGYPSSTSRAASRRPTARRPIRYLTRRRIERAQDLLRAANLTVTEVCMLVGFASLGSFSSRFTPDRRREPDRLPGPVGGAGRAAGARLLPVHARGAGSARHRGPGRRGLRKLREAPASRAGLRSSHDHERFPGHRVLPGPGPGPRLLRHAPRLRAAHRHLAGRGLPLGHRRAPQPARAGRRAHDARAAARPPRPPTSSGGSWRRARCTDWACKTDDCRKTYAELSAKGVTFLQEPADRPYGVEAVMRDNSGNWMVLIEPREFSPEDFATGG